MIQPLPHLTTCLLAASLLTLMTGCGDEKRTSVPSPAAEPALPAQSALTPDRFLTITANDQMKFNRTEIKAAPGEVLSLTLQNEGRMPKYSMGHNVVVLDTGVEVASYVRAAMTAADHDYLPPAYRASVIAATRMLGGGEADTIVFQLPTKPGRYPFVCSFPGHFQAGMAGVIIVE